MRRDKAFGRVSAKAVSCALGAASALTSVGCDEPLKRVDLIADLRVLGARVEVEGEPGARIAGSW